MTDKKIEIKGLSLEELRALFLKLGESKFRADQVYNWLYNKLIFNPEEMLNLSLSLRKKLSEKFSFFSLTKIDEQHSRSTGTKKFLYETFDGRKIESVIIPDKERNTLCISTQVGCPLDCKFCATGLMGYKRNLSPGEIVDQYLLSAKELGKDAITNIVFMGMGEPLLNYKGTVRSLEIFTSEQNAGVSKHRITVSTSGIPKKVRELADTGLRVKLALSLHSCFEDIRSKIMPINEKYSLAENMEAIKYYLGKTKSRITFEYTMLAGVNDREEDLKALVRLCSSLPSKINIIPFNSIKHMDPDGFSGQLEPTSMENIREFVEKLRAKNITVMLRDTQGDDIAAACGQLAVKAL